LLSFEEGVEVVGDAVIIFAVHDAVDQRLERPRITKDTLSDGIEGILERLGNLELAIAMSVSQIFDLLREMTEEKGLLTKLSDRDTHADPDRHTLSSPISWAISMLAPSTVAMLGAMSAKLSLWPN
jgi:hypothetical protein